MSKIENEARLRREKDILDRIENVKRLIQMETTLLTADGARRYVGYKSATRDDKAFGQGLLFELQDEIQMQLLSIVALCYGDNPDVGEPVPMLEWKVKDMDGMHPQDKFREVWRKCLDWNA